MPSGFVELFEQSKLQEQVALRAALQADLAAARDEPAERERLEGEVKKAAARIETLQRKIADRKRFVTELEQLEADVATKEATVAVMAAEIEKMRLETDVPPRVTVVEEPHLVGGN